MASPISTGGFQVQAQPGISYLPPAAFSSGSANILPNISNGAKLISQLQGIRDEAQLRPILQQIEQIKLAEAQGRLEQLPMEAKAKRLALLQQLEQPVVTAEEVIGGAVDENGLPFGGSGVNRIGYTRDEDLNPIPFERIVIKETDEERNRKFRAAEASIRATDALAAQRGTPKTFEYDVLVQRRDQALEDGDREVAALYDARLKRMSTLPSLIPAGTTYNRRVEQLAADAGITLDRAMELSKTAEGAEALAQAAVANKAAARSPFGAPQLTGAQQQLIRPSAQPPIAAPFEEETLTEVLSEPVVAAPVVVKSKAERDALPPGTSYIGPDGKTYIKK